MGYGDRNYRAKSIKVVLRNFIYFVGILMTTNPGDFFSKYPFVIFAKYDISILLRQNLFAYVYVCEKIIPLKNSLT